MKKLWFVILLILVSTRALLGQEIPCRQPDVEPKCTVAGEHELSAGDEVMLRRIWEEEKLARDTYLVLAKKWPRPRIFANIARAEQRHMDAIEGLLERNGREAPPPLATGIFEDATFAEAFASLSRMGRQTPILALEVGARIEEMDIADLNRALCETENPEVQQVLGNLRAASGRHLTAYIQQLEARGKTYSPKYLTATEVSVILDWNRKFSHPRVRFRNDGY